MTYQTLPFAHNLRRARAAKGWSQRDLSAKVGLTQAHVSRIERGEVDLRLSTFVELARVLDLDVVLTPRNAISAVQALIREAEVNSEFKAARAATTELNAIVRQLAVDFPKDPTVDELAVLSTELHGLAVTNHTPGVSADLAQIAKDLQSASRASPTPAQLGRYLERLRDLRNGMAHGRPDVGRPAYSLDDED
jgi:transcriptional regulator with XRE-family HTH domain